ncbi:hypothetical protein WG906_08125 [Pedobacter sp. P351]|uniref:hypothetical protein n=1 Tax=Pedobacter superstes TaxID=3133441 RepID=UPI0030A4B70C
MEWKLVFDSLPTDMEEVLLFDELKGLSVGYYFIKNKSFIRHIDGHKLNNVKYWLTIPSVVV